MIGGGFVLVLVYVFSFSFWFLVGLGCWLITSVFSVGGRLVVWLICVSRLGAFEVTGFMFLSVRFVLM